MRVSRLAKNVLTYVPVLAVFAATVLGLLVGNALYPAAPDSQPETPSPLPGDPSYPQPLFVPKAEGRCAGPLIYTSLPPKCKTWEGKFIPLEDMPLLVLPKR